jgi:hypothetical protein
MLENIFASSVRGLARVRTLRTAPRLPGRCGVSPLEGVAESAITRRMQRWEPVPHRDYLIQRGKGQCFDDFAIQG